MQWLEAARRPTPDAAFLDRSRPLIHHCTGDAVGAAEIRSSFVVGFVSAKP
jgi:hypothetical protein